VLGNEVDEFEGVALGGQPGGVRACPAADVEDARRSRRKSLAQQLLGAQELQPALGTREACRLVVAGRVELDQPIVRLGRRVHASARSHKRTGVDGPARVAVRNRPT